ncbi:APC family permease [Catenulispora rubra]|uniref:APC family permease n=1 Tax=Catenulispora rubra TaxID=280293 RepID=UPI001E52DA7D|nr:APC family permease [Catenulispora rubra]
MQYGPFMGVFGAYSMAYAAGAPGLELLTTIVLFICLAKVVAYFAARQAGTGGILTYTSTNTGYVSSFVATAGLFTGYIAMIGSTVTATSVFVTGVLYNMGFESATQGGWQIAILALIAVSTTTVCYFGLDASFWVSAILGLTCIPVIAWLLIQYAAHHGIHIAPLFDVSHFSLSTSLAGMVFMSSAFIGFDGLATLAADTAEPRKNMPRILYATVLFGAPMLAISLFLQWPIANTDAFAAGETASSIMAKQGGVSWMAIPIDVLISASMIAAAIAFLNFAARMIATMGDIGLLPRSLGKRSERDGTPRRATIVAGALSLIVPIGVALLVGGIPSNAVVYLAAAIGYSWGIAYIVVAIVAVRVVARNWRSKWGVAAAAVVSVIGFVAFEINGLRRGFTSADATQAWICVGATAVLTGVFLLVRKRSSYDIDVTAIDGVE